MKMKLPIIPTNATIKQAVKLASAKDLIFNCFEKYNSQRHLNAFTYFHPKSKLLNEAEKMDNDTDKDNDAAKPKDKPLNGIPIAIKDNFCVEGMPATCGSKMLQDFFPPYTATVVQKLIDAGAIIVGKTNMDEFGMGCGTLDSIFGPTKNIWELNNYRKNVPESFSDWRIPGGSSGGSAVAVASGICFAALGSDTGGSTRNPASYCGVVGLKPTYGLLSRHGLIPLVNSLDVPGILTRTVEDCTTILNTIQGFDEKDSTSLQNQSVAVKLNPEFNIKNLKIGIPDEFVCPEMDAEVIECWNEVSDLLRSHGAQVVKVSLPHTKYSIACYSVLNPCEVASNMARYDGLRFGHRATNPSVNSTESLYATTRHEGFNEVVRGRILAGNYFLLKANYEQYFAQALRVRRLIYNDFLNVFGSGVNLLLTPVTLSAAPKYSDFVQLDNRSETALQDYCTQSVNMAGVPAISLPIKLNPVGLPLSLQLIGPQLGESLLLNMATVIENFVKFPVHKDKTMN